MRLNKGRRRDILYLKKKTALFLKVNFSTTGVKIREKVEFPFSPTTLSEEIFSHLKKKTRSLILIVDPPLLLGRELFFPFTSSWKIKRVLKYSLEPLIPFSPEEIHATFTTLYRGKTGAKVWSVVLPPRLLEFLKRVEEEGIEITGVYLSTHLLLHALLPGRKVKGRILLLYGEDGRLLLQEVREGNPAYFAEIPASGEVLNLILLNLKGKEEGGISFVVEGEVGENIINRIKEEGKILEKRERIKGLPPLEKLFFLQLTGIKRSLNLLPPSGEGRWSVKLPVLLFLVFLSLLSYRVGWERKTKEAQLKTIDGRMRDIYLSLFPDSPLKANPLYQLKSKLKEEEARLPLGKERISFLEVLRGISVELPPDPHLKIKAIGLHLKSFEIEGETGSYRGVDEIVKNLNNFPLFTSVKIINAKSEKEKVHFRIEGKIEKVE